MTAAPGNSFTTAELARFDQEWHKVERSVDALLRVYRDMTSDGEVSREVDLLCFAAALPELIPADDCAAMLACAVARLAQKGPAR